MGLDELKFWHWTLISLILGPLVWFMFSGPVQPTVDQQTQELFERQVRSADGTQPMAYNITVYPAIEATAGQNTAQPMMVVTYTGLIPVPDKPNTFEKQNLWFAAPIPYKPIPKPSVDLAVPRAEWPGVQELYTPPDPNVTISQVVEKVYGGFSVERMRAFRAANFDLNGHDPSVRNGASFRAPETIAEYYRDVPRMARIPLIVPWDPAKNLTVLDYLKACKKVYPWVNYRFGWWKLPNVEKMIYIGGTFLIVGLIWPTFLWSLTTLGMGKAPKETYDLSRFGRGKPEPKKEAPVPANVLTDDDKKRLEEMEAALTASLADGIGKDRQPEEKKPDAEVRKLTETAPVQATAPTTPEEAKSYEGQFYPVAKGHEHPHTPPAAPEQPKKVDKKQGP